jgi:hypothetical protein
MKAAAGYDCSRFVVTGLDVAGSGSADREAAERRVTTHGDPRTSGQDNHAVATVVPQPLLAV